MRKSMRAVAVLALMAGVGTPMTISTARAEPKAPKAKAHLQQQADAMLKKLGGGFEISHGPYANDDGTGTWGVTFKIKTGFGAGWVEVRGVNDKFAIELRGIAKDAHKLIVEPILKTCALEVARLFSEDE